MSYGSTRPKRRRLPGTPGPIFGHPPRELCDETCEALAALFAEIVEAEKKGAHRMGPRGRVEVANELRRRRDFPHLRRPRNPI